MISSLRGSVLHVSDDLVVIEVGGVGLSVATTPQIARATHIGDQLHLHTTLIVREDALSLYGFAEREELEAFGLLIGVTGVGPKSALGVLSALTVGQIAEAVAAEDDAPFRRVSGIGPKTAKLIVVQLAGKVVAPAGASPAGRADAGSIVQVQVVQALAGLGWSEKVAAEAVASVAESSSESTVAGLLRLTLAALGPARKEPAGG